jgi:hypothetical protein
MGAVEAALRNKPVIITDFGGLKEYVKTPFIVRAPCGPVGQNAEFLFNPDMTWGQPRIDDLIKHMKFCYNNKVTTQQHEYTLEKVINVTTFFSRDVCSSTCTVD